MHLISIYHPRMVIIGILLICSSVDSLSVGLVNNTRFTSVDYLNIGSIWLSNFTTWSQCVCEVLSGNFSSMAVALNMYLNGSCQLFVALPLTYKLEINNNSTLILLKQLSPINLAPCCSNLSWLINQMNVSQPVSAAMNKSSYFIIDDNNLLFALSYRISLFQLNRTTLNTIQQITTFNSPTSLSYHNGFYYIPSCPSTCVVNVVSTKNLSIIATISLPGSTVIREITFIRNSSLMLIASYSSNQILFYNVNSINNYTLSTPSSITVNSPCGLYAVNDSFIYVASWTSAIPVSTLTYSNNTWSLSSLTNTTPSSGKMVFQTTVDTCGRLWLAVSGIGIQIFDPWGHSLLYQWPVSISINGFLLLNNYELFVTNFTGPQIYHFNPNIGQCTS